MDAVLQLSSNVGIESACDALGVARGSFYRQHPLLGPTLSVPPPTPAVRPIPARALSSDERQSVRALLNSERFQRTARPQPFMQLCSMKANMFARLGPCHSVLPTRSPLAGLAAVLHERPYCGCLPPAVRE